MPEKIKIPYFKVKILELFLYLEALEISDASTQKPYFYKTQVEKTKAMKQCFKSIYGMPIGTWLLQ